MYLMGLALLIKILYQIFHLSNIGEVFTMKCSLAHKTFWLLFLPVVLSLSELMWAQNTALLIGVSEYKDPTWCQLSTNNDIALLEKRLSTRFSISICKDEKATYDGICSSLSALKENAQMGDTVFIHFSGHGQQMVTGDKTEADNLDEAIIPYDAFYKYTPGVYEGECHFRDNELSSFINEIRRKVGTNGFVIVCLDACHSGNSNKGANDNLPIRGTMDIFGEETLSEGLSDYFKTDSTEIEKDGAEVVYISACKPWDVNQEIRINDVGYGSLSYSIAMALDNVDISDIPNWLDYIYYEIKEDLGLSQTPMFNNSFGYVPSIEINNKIPEDIIEIVDDEYSGANKKSHVFLVTLVGAIIIVLVFVYGKFKKK